MSGSPGVTKSSGHKIPDATNPVRINNLEPGRTYYFVITVVNKSGESKESKELAYNAVADQIGLVYWKNLFDQPMEDRQSDTAEKRPSVESASSKALPKNEALRDETALDANASRVMAKKNVQSSEERATEPANIQKDPAENSKLTAVGVESGPNELPEMEKMRLKAAKMLASSHFYIFFKHDSNDLSAKAIEKLDRIYNILADNTYATLTLNGYSDSSGDPSFNQMVSEVRANSVKSYLAGKGIEPSRMTALGHGANKYLASNKVAEGRALNRRVEIELIMP